MEKHLNQLLTDRKKENLYRKMRTVNHLAHGSINVDGKDYINFSSNDYLSFSSELDTKFNDASYISGTCASRLMTGTMLFHEKLEEKTAEFKNKPSALVLNSGYQANVGIISSLVNKNDVVFSDKLNHASIIDGIKLSQASFYRFRHNDIAHLESLLKKYRKDYRNALIITETVFSMDGDISPIKEIALLKNQYDFLFMVDEAHATGIFGENGSGIAEREQVSDKIDIIMGTYSKAMAGFGAYAACSKTIKNYLINYCRSLIYSTSLPEYVMKINLRALEKIKTEPFRRQQLLDNAAYLRSLLTERGFQVCGESQIVPIMFGETVRALNVSEQLKKKGYWVTAVRPPTVPAGRSRIRLSLSYAHSKELLERFVIDLKEAVA